MEKVPSYYYFIDFLEHAANVAFARAYMFSKGRKGEAKGTMRRGRSSSRWRERTHPEPSFHRERRTAREIRDTWKRSKKGERKLDICSTL